MTNDYKSIMFDKEEILGKSRIQHGINNDRVYLMKLHPDDLNSIVDRLYNITIQKRYSKIFAKVPEWALDTFLKQNYIVEASVPGLFKNKVTGYFLAKFFSAKRSYVSKDDLKLIESIKNVATEVFDPSNFKISENYIIRKLNSEDIYKLASLYKKVFQVYPFPIWEDGYLKKSMESNVIYFGVFKNDHLIAASSAEIDKENSNAEMTDFATHSDYLGKNLSYFLLQDMEKVVFSRGIKTLYTIARATSHGMNKTFGRSNYKYAGTLINNTLIGNSIESMNIWYKNKERA